MTKYPQALVWFDIQTANLPEGNDYSGVEILEVAAIGTDFDLSPFGGFYSTVKLTPASVGVLKDNEFVLNMHKENGLIEEAKENGLPLDEIEDTIISILQEKTTFVEGEFELAGSEVSTWELPLIREKMPKLYRWLVRYTFDIGNAGRVIRGLNHGQSIVNSTPSKKTNRASDQVKADILEAKLYQQVLGENFA